MALATLNPIHWLSGATDARNKIEGSSVLKVRHLFIPIVGTHAVISAPEIRTRDKARRILSGVGPGKHLPGKHGRREGVRSPQTRTPHACLSADGCGNPGRSGERLPRGEARA